MRVVARSGNRNSCQQGSDNSGYQQRKAEADKPNELKRLDTYCWLCAVDILNSCLGTELRNVFEVIDIPTLEPVLVFNNVAPKELPVRLGSIISNCEYGFRGNIPRSAIYPTQGSNGRRKSPA